MIALDLPPQNLVLPERPALILPGENRIESLDRALLLAGLSRPLRRAVLKVVSAYAGKPPGELIARVRQEPALHLAMAPIVGYSRSFGAAPPPAAITWPSGANASANAPSSPYTFSAVPSGTASPDRYLAAFIGSRGAAGGFTISNVTIRSVTATQVAFANAVNGEGGAGMYIAAVPTGTTADVVVTFTNGGPMSVILWALTSLVSSTPTNQGTSTADPASLTTNISAGGVAIGGVFAIDEDPITWTNLNENVDALFDLNRRYSGASAAFASAQTSLVLSADFTTLIDANSPVGVFGVWR